MDRMTELHISFLREMLSSKRQDLADAARKELAGIMADLNKKGVIVV